MASVVWEAEPAPGKVNRLIAEQAGTKLRMRLLVKKGDTEWKSDIREIDNMTLAAFAAAVKEMPAKWHQLKEKAGATYLALRIWFVPETNLILRWIVRHTEVQDQPAVIEDDFKVLCLTATDDWKLALAHAV